MTTSTRTAKQAAREAEDSKPVKGLARFGLTGRGVVYVVLALVTLQVALGRGGRADRDGALAQVKERPFGNTLLVVLALAFAGYAVWRLLEAAVGHRDADQGKERVVKQIGSLARAVLYGSFAVSTFRFVLTSAVGHDKTKPLTARAMALPGGRVAVGLVGVAVVGGGLFMVYRALRRKFLDKLDLASASARVQKAAESLGLAGLASRGLVLALIGGFLLQAAVTFDPKKAKGLDAALKSLAGHPFGPLLLVAAAAGLLAFGLWSFVEARYRKV
jgi:hypothetical protein